MAVGEKRGGKEKSDSNRREILRELPFGQNKQMLASPREANEEREENDGGENNPQKISSLT